MIRYKVIDRIQQNMQVTAHYKRSLFTTPKCNNADKKIKEKAVNLGSLNQTQKVIRLTNQSKQKIKLDTDSKEVLQQLEASYLYSLFSSFQQMLKDTIEGIMSKILSLEYKLANCQRKFNSIQLQLHKKAKSIKVLSDENRVLRELNRDIEGRIKSMKQKYQSSFINFKNSWVGNLTDKLAAQIQEFQIKRKQCESCRRGTKDRIRKYLSKLQTLEVSNETEEFRTDMVKSNLKQMLQMIFQEQGLNKDKDEKTLKSLEDKFLENIDLKFQVYDLKSQVRELNKRLSVYSKGQMPATFPKGLIEQQNNLINAC